MCLSRHKDRRIGPGWRCCRLPTATAVRRVLWRGSARYRGARCRRCRSATSTLGGTGCRSRWTGPECRCWSRCPTFRTGPCEAREGPYRVTPNWMVVIPTDEHVELTYGATGVEYLAWLATVLGAIALAVVAVRPPVRFDRRRSPGSRHAGSVDAPAGRAGARWQRDGTQRHGCANSSATPPRLLEEPPAVSVVLPAYEAEHLVGAAVTEIGASSALRNAALDGRLEIVVVDDGSTDGTAEAARRAGADVVVSSEANRGKGAAVRMGMLAASGTAAPVHGRGSWPTRPASSIPFIDVLDGGADVALGSRRHAEARTISPAPATRALASRMFNVFTRLGAAAPLPRHAVRLQGLHCGPRRSEIFSRSVIDGFAFDVEVLYLVEHLGLDGYRSARGRRPLGGHHGSARPRSP